MGLSSVNDVNKRIKELEGIKKSRLEEISFDEIRKLIEELLRQYHPLTFSGRIKFMYRARINEDENAFHHVSDFRYPPFYKAKLNRANIEREPVFYCCSTIKTAIKEIKPKNGDRATVMECCWKNWEDINKIIVLGFGFSDDDEFEVDNEVVIGKWQNYRKEKLEKHFENKGKDEIEKRVKINTFIDEFLYKKFSEYIEEDEESYKYKIPAAVANCLKTFKYNSRNKEKVKVEGFCYPSVKKNSDKDGSPPFNYAFIPQVYDKFLEPRSFLEYEVVNIEKDDFRLLRSTNKIKPCIVW